MSGAAAPAENERRKIAAAFLNTLATVIVATGGIGPRGRLDVSADRAHVKAAAWVLVLWIVVGCGFHLTARQVRRGVRR